MKESGITDNGEIHGADLMHILSHNRQNMDCQTM